MYPLGLDKDERRAYVLALRGGPEDSSIPARDDDNFADDDPKSGDTPTTPASDPGANPMRLVTANVKHTMTRDRIVEDVKKVGGLGSVVMWQEVKEGAFADAIQQHLPSNAWQHLFLNHEVTVSVKRAQWDVLHATAYKMHDHYPSGGDPTRWLGVALLQLKGTGIQFLVCNSHFVANAWNGARRQNTAWKQRNWNLHYDKYQSLVLDARSKGITVVGGGDWNKASVPKFHTSQEWLRQAHIDYLFGLQATGGATFTKQADQSVSLNSDHNALVAQLAWTAGSNPVGTYSWPGL